MQRNKFVTDGLLRIGEIAKEHGNSFPWEAVERKDRSKSRAHGLINRLRSEDILVLQGDTLTLTPKGQHEVKLAQKERIEQRLTTLRLQQSKLEREIERLEAKRQVLEETGT